jgi:hypothetical protein
VNVPNNYSVGPGADITLTVQFYDGLTPVSDEEYTQANSDDFFVVAGIISGTPQNYFAAVGNTSDGTAGDAPSISNFDVFASGQDVDVSFDSDEQLSTISVALSGDASGTLTESDFTESGSGGAYTYTAAVSDGQDGTFTATLNTAEDSAGNDGANSQSDSVTVGSGGGGNQAPSVTIGSVSYSNNDKTVTVVFTPEDPDGNIDTAEITIENKDDEEVGSVPNLDIIGQEGQQVTYTFANMPNNKSPYTVSITVTDTEGSTSPIKTGTT